MKSAADGDYLKPYLADLKESIASRLRYITSNDRGKQSLSKVPCESPVLKRKNDMFRDITNFSHHAPQRKNLYSILQCLMRHARQGNVKEIGHRLRGVVRKSVKNVGEINFKIGAQVG